MTIDGIVQGGRVILACRECGPLGVAEDRETATSAVLIHLAWHGCDLSQINMKEPE